MLYQIVAPCSQISDFYISKKDSLFLTLKSEKKELLELEGKFKQLEKTDLENLKRFKLYTTLKKDMQEAEKLIDETEKQKEKYNPSKFSKENCSLVFCSESCDEKYQKSLFELSRTVNSINSKLQKIRLDIYYYTDGKINREQYRQKLKNLVLRIDIYARYIENYTQQKINQYSFNQKEIKERGDFYRGKLLDIKNKIQNAIKEDNFYLYSKYIHEGIGTKIINIYNEYKETFRELDKDFFILLKDKKVEYRAVFSVYSWDDYQDYPTEHTLTKEAKISESLYQNLKRFIQKTKGERELCKGKIHSPVCYIENDELRKIVNLLTNQINYLDTDLEIYVEELYPIYYHLYEIVSSNGKRETRWVEVDKRSYETFKELNTVIMAKPLGYFEDQIKIKPNEIYKSVVNNPYYAHTTNPDIYPVLWVIRNRLPEITLPDKNYPEDYRKEQMYRYYSSKKVLKDYAKKYGLDKKKLEEYKRENYTTSTGTTGGGRGLGSRYRGGGYGGFGK